jgi:chitinase
MLQCCLYFDTWASKWVDNPNNMDLAQIQSPTSIVNLSFVHPTCKYKKDQNTFHGTGLDFSQDFWVVREAIAILRRKGIKVMLSVGGGAYWSDSAVVFQPLNCVALMNDLGCDGIDLDWEVGEKFDWQLTEAIKNLKPLMPQGKFISFAGTGTGAFGKNGDNFQGMNIHAMVNQGGNVDWICIMAYDAGKFDAIGALECYRIFYKGPLLVGFEIGDQAWGGYKLTLGDVVNVCCRTLKENVNNGIFIWCLHKDPAGTPTVHDILTVASCIA